MCGNSLSGKKNGSTFTQKVLPMFLRGELCSKACSHMPQCALQNASCFHLSLSCNFTRGGYLRSKMGMLMACSQGMVSPTGCFQAQHQVVAFQNTWAWKQPVRETIPNLPRRELYFLSSHMLYLTSQRTKLSVLWCFGVLIVNKDHCINIGAKTSSGRRDMQINAPFPMQSTHEGKRCTLCACSPVSSYAGWLNKI